MEIENPSNVKIGRLMVEFATMNSAYDAGDIDPYEIYRECREHNPITEGDFLAKFGIPSQADFTAKGRKVYTLYRYADVQRVLRETETFSASLLMEGFAQFIGEDAQLSGMDGAEHRQLRSMLQPAFGPKQMQRWSQDVGTCVRQTFLYPMRASGGCELVRDFAVPFPIQIVYQVLGFPDDSDSAREFATLALKILSGFSGDAKQAEQAMKGAFDASQSLYDLILPIVARRRAEGSIGGDMIATLLRAKLDGDMFNDAQVTRIIRMLIVPATETTTRTFGNLMLHLLRRPDVLNRVRADRSLVSRAVTESMRYETVSAFLARLAIKDTEIAGVKIPAGTALSLAVGSANRDSATFVNGDEFDIDRPFKPNMAFGAGVHMCVGLPIARLEVEAALNAILDLMPDIRFDPDHPTPIAKGLQLRGPEKLHAIWN